MIDYFCKLSIIELFLLFSSVKIFDKEVLSDSFFAEFAELIKFDEFKVELLGELEELFDDIV